MSQPPPTIALTPATIASFKAAKVFKEKHLAAGSQFTSVSFYESGEHALTTAEDDMLHVFNVQDGTHKRALASKKYGCNLARFAHSRSSAVYASTKEDDALRYLDLNTNQFKCYFQGHTKTVVSLEVSPSDDGVLSAAPDDSVRLWDLRTTAPRGFLPIIGHPCACFDPIGLVFAVAMSFPHPVINLYDLREFASAPFSSVELAETFGRPDLVPLRLPIITSLAFSNDNKLLLVGTSGDEHYVLDALDLFMRARLVGHSGLEKLGEEQMGPHDPPRAGASGAEVSWTPDGRYVVSGSLDGKICIWDVAPPEGSPEAANRPPPGAECILTPSTTLQGHQGKPSRVVAFNPRFACMATGGTELAFWLPSV